MTRLGRHSIALLASLLVLSACGGSPSENDPEEPLEVIISDTTEVMDEVTRQSLAEFTDAGTLRFAETTPQLRAVKVGDVVVSEPSDAAPYGYLRRVTAISQQDGGLRLETEQANLEEAIEQGEVEIDHQFSEDDIAYRVDQPSTGITGIQVGTFGDFVRPDDGFDVPDPCPPATEYYQPQCGTPDDGDGGNEPLAVRIPFEKEIADNVTVSGEFVTQLITRFWASISDFKVEKVGAVLGGKQWTELKLEAFDNPDIKGEYRLGVVTGGKQTVQIGPVPVVYEPKLEVDLVVDGSVDVRARASFAVEQAASVQMGFEYRDGDFHNLSDAGIDFDAEEPEIDGPNANARAAVRAHAKLELYGGVAGFGAAGNAFGTIDVELGRDPFWRLLAGLKVELTAELLLRIPNPVPSSAPWGLGEDIVLFDEGWSATVINEEVELKQGSGPDDEPDDPPFGPQRPYDPDRRVEQPQNNTAPLVTIASPATGQELVRDAPAILRATSFDPDEPGSSVACDSLNWTSSVPTDPFPATGCEAEVVFPDRGERTLTVTGTDPQGASGTASVTVDVVDQPVNLPPTARITSPEDAELQTREPNPLSGTATDPEGDEPLSFEWSAAVDGGAPVTIGTTPNLRWTPSDTFDFSDSGRYEVVLRLNVTDPEGHLGSDSMVIEVFIVN